VQCHYKGTHTDLRRAVRVSQALGVEALEEPKVRNLSHPLFRDYRPLVSL